MRAAILILCFLFHIVAEAKIGGFLNFLCSPDPTKVFFPCAVDCIHNHGALNGTCGDMTKGDYNCYCDGVSKSGHVDPLSNHCTEETDDFRTICTIDCTCEHGAFGGYCDWKKKACYCMGQGLNKYNQGCFTKNSKDMSMLIYNYGGDRLSATSLMAIKTNVAGLPLPHPPTPTGR